MLISCPKCNAVYQVSDNQIPSEGKKFKCAECGEIWMVKPVENKIQTPTSQPVATPSSAQVKSQIASPQSTEEDDLQKMFNRLSQDTKGLFSGKSSSDTKWELFKRKIILFFTPFMINCLLLLCMFAFTLYIGYANRFELVSFIPQLENFYNKLGIESIYKGRGIVFKNIKIKNIDRHGKTFVEVTGLIYNAGNKKSLVLPIKATLLNNSGEIVSETTKTLTLDRLEPEFSAVFRILLPDDSFEEKKVILVFDESAFPQSAQRAKRVSNKE